MDPESAVARTDEEIVAAWVAQGGARLDPMRLHHIAVLRRRVAGAQGALRGALEQRLAARVAACADELARGALAARQVAEGGSGDAPAMSPLLSLVEALQRQAAARTRAVHGAQAQAFPELPALEPARRQWSAVRSRSRLQSALAPPPVDAGPLNSTQLVHRAFALMRALSPGYLQYFLEHLDTVSGLERLTGPGAVSDGDAGRASPGRKPRNRAAPRRRGS